MRVTSSFLHLGEQLGAHPVAALAAVFLGGVLTSLTPCLYPMIPITVAVIGGGVAVPTRARRIGLALLYAAGLAAAYSSLGILAAMTGHTWVAATQRPVLSFAYLFAFSLGMCSLLLVAAVLADTTLHLPRAGPWMLWVKRGFALVLLGVAEYYLITTGQLVI